MQSNFRGRLYKFMAINANALVRGAWLLIRNFVDAFTIMKMNVLGADC